MYIYDISYSLDDLCMYSLAYIHTFYILYIYIYVSCVLCMTCQMLWMFLYVCIYILVHAITYVIICMCIHTYYLSDILYYTVYVFYDILCNIYEYIYILYMYVVIYYFGFPARGAKLDAVAGLIHEHFRHSTFCVLHFPFYISSVSYCLF